MDRFIQGVRFLRRSRKFPRSTEGRSYVQQEYESRVTDISRTPSREGGGKWTKCLVLSKIVQQHRLSSLYPRRRLCIEYRWTLSRRGNISKVGGESFEKIISINCHFTTASFKRVDRSLEISEPRYRYRLILFTIVDRSSDSILPIHEYKGQEYCNERKEESRDDKMTITEYRSARSLSTFLVE